MAQTQVSSRLHSVALLLPFGVSDFRGPKLLLGPAYGAMVIEAWSGFQLVPRRPCIRGSSRSDRRR